MRIARFVALPVLLAVGLGLTASPASATEARTDASAIGILGCTEAYIDGGNWLNWYPYLTCLS